MENNILFDDWEVRREGNFNRRKKDYNIASVFIGVLCLFSIIAAEKTASEERWE